MSIACPHAREIRFVDEIPFSPCDELSRWCGWDAWVPPDLNCGSDAAKDRALYGRIIVWDKPLNDPIIGSLENAVSRLTAISGIDRTIEALIRAVENCLPLSVALSATKDVRIDQERLHIAAKKCPLRTIQVYADESRDGVPVLFQAILPDVPTGRVVFVPPYGWIVSRFP